MPTATKPLEDYRVLITRPRAQADRLKNLIIANGGIPVSYPVFDIVSQAGSESMDSALKQLGNVALIIIVSIHAARSLAATCQQLGIGIPTGTKVAAIGPATAKCLVTQGIPVDIQPVGSIDSEGLLASLANVDLKDRSVIIFRGQNGREFLGESLRSNGAKVIQLESYQRQLNPDPIQPSLNYWLCGERQILIASSVAIIKGVLDKVGSADHNRVKSCPLVVFSERIANACRELGFVGAITIAARPDDKSVVEAAINYVGLSQG